MKALVVRGTKRNTIKIGLAMAVTAASLGLASAAAAATGSDVGTVPTPPAVTTDTTKDSVPAARVPKFSASSTLKTCVRASSAGC